jgi:hypothetical protein
MALASALRKLERATQVIPSQTAQPAFAHLYIVNPLGGTTLSGVISKGAPTFKTAPKSREAVSASSSSNSSFTWRLSIWSIIRAR